LYQEIFMSQRLQDIAQQLVAHGKGILAADESTSSIKKRLDSIGVESTPESRRDYREMLFRADAMRESISGVILFDETLRQNAADGTPLRQLISDAGSLIGIKVDTGATPLPNFPGETITEGLDGLGKRIAEYYELGARFAKWRGVIAISNGLPTWGAVRSNAHALARYAALCQAGGIVPIVEPEVVMDGVPGDHSIERCQEVTRWVLETVFAELKEARVDLAGIILKPNMIIDGKHARKASAQEVAERTVNVLKANVPATVPGIAFLSGGQSTEEATAHLSAMNAMGPLPWKLTFSYGRALQASALKAWGGKTENVAAGQRAFTHRAKMNGLAAIGSWDAGLEQAA
jgi:fructose-bisphosphate aldolase class I